VQSVFWLPAAATVLVLVSFISVICWFRVCFGCVFLVFLFFSWALAAVLLLGVLPLYTALYSPFGILVRLVQEFPVNIMLLKKIYNKDKTHALSNTHILKLFSLFQNIKFLGYIIFCIYQIQVVLSPLI